MVESSVLVAAVVFGFVGAVVVSRGRELRDRYTTLEALVTDVSDERIEPGSESTIRGPVHVTEPASPARTGADLADGDVPAIADGEGSPALWAWRVRRKGRTGGPNGETRWRTVDGGLAVGAFAIDHGWDRIRVDAAGLTDEEADPDDPFDSSWLYLGDPETSVYLGDLDPVNRFLDRTGLADEGGIISDLEVSISVGGKTNWPDKYQATVVRAGDELVVRGELTETDDGYVLRSTEETPLVIASGDLETKANRLRSKARTRRLAGLGLLALGSIIAVAGFL